MGTQEESGLQGKYYVFRTLGYRTGVATWAHRAWIPEVLGSLLRAEVEVSGTSEAG